MKPKPVVVTTICSECGLPWESHGDNPTAADCIRLLKAALASRRYPQITYWSPSQQNTCSADYSYRIPQALNMSCSEVAA